MKRPFLLLISAGFFGLISGLQAQTKIIAYKSHSGSAEHMSLSLELGLIPYANMGIAPQRIVKNAVLDSLIFLNDSTTVMVTSEYCQDLNRPPRVKKIRPSAPPGLPWKAGKDTVTNHKHFKRTLPEDSIRCVLQRHYHFRNSSMHVVIRDKTPDQLQKKTNRKSKKAARKARKAKKKHQQDNQGPLPPLPGTQKPDQWLFLLLTFLLSLAIPQLVKQYKCFQISEGE